MKKLFALAVAVFTAATVGFAVPAFADSPGQLGDGPDLYQVRNVTQNGGYGSSVTAACNETVKFSIKLSNVEFGLLTNVTVRAPLNGTMTASATNAAGQNTSVSGNVTVNVPANGTLAYVAGSTVNLDVNGNLIRNLPDGITTGGVNKGNLNGSTREFVQFQAKVNCEETPPPVNIQVCELATKRIITIREDQFNPNLHTRDLSKCAEVPPPGKIVVCEISTGRIITIKENEFDANKHTRDLSRCAKPPVVPAGTTPTALPDTGTGEVLAMFASVVVGGMLAYRLVWSRYSA